MRESFAHDARAVLTSDEPDERALGAAVTRALCGTWEHEGPCPLAAGALEGPDGVTTRWRLVAAGPGVVRADEREHAGRLVAS